MDHFWQKNDTAGFALRIFLNNIVQWMGLIVYESCINAFSQKILIVPHNPGYAVLQLIVYKGLFSSFSQGKGLKETFILKVFLKETLFSSIWSLWSEMVWGHHNFGSTLNPAQ